MLEINLEQFSDVMVMYHNKKIFINFSKTDVMNLLESAGFSRSNPYYIVKQGKVRFLKICM